MVGADFALWGKSGVDCAADVVFGLVCAFLKRGVISCLILLRLRSTERCRYIGQCNSTFSVRVLRISFEYSVVPRCSDRANFISLFVCVAALGSVGFDSPVQSCLEVRIVCDSVSYIIADPCSRRSIFIQIFTRGSESASVEVHLPVQSCFGVRTVRFLFSYAVVFWCSRYAVLFGRLRSGFRLDWHGGVFLIFRARYLDKRLSSSLLSWRSFSSLGVSETTCLR